MGSESTRIGPGDPRHAGEGCDGAFIIHPDTDLEGPTLNTSGVPWHPREVFRHALSIRAPA
jgi:hypothetical protein